MFSEGRMLDYLIVGVIALIVVGPKDLPILMRKVGQFVAKMRGMANEFRASFDELARQSELEDLRKEVEAMRVNQQSVMTSLTGAGSPGTTGIFDDINQHLSEPLTPAPAPPPVVETPEAPPALATAKPARAPRAKAAASKPAPPKPAAPKPTASKAATAKAADPKPAAAKPRKAAKTTSQAS